MTTYSIHVVEYATAPDNPIGAFLNGKYNAGVCPILFGFIVIRGEGIVALVDAGFDWELHDKKHTSGLTVDKWESPAKVLQSLGIAPADVTHVLPTHAHFDHLGGLRYFPNAHFYMQERELSDWVWRMSLDSRFRWLTSFVDSADILECIDLARKGRFTLLKGRSDNVLPGIDLVPAFDTHTAGSQYVVVRNSAGTQADSWILAGDLVYQFENLDGGDAEKPFYLPIGAASGSAFNLVMTTHEMIEAAGGDRTRVIPVHESRLAERFPSATSEYGLKVIELCLGDGHESVLPSVEARAAAASNR
ncbi:conserved hypothetical protein [Mesorhizobium plurifarium]|uniref:Metallo-beta-lactamase domain-containing protein n=1 Tax=Mesorhizobium plurifarium TaxID=69974 RepID=A0A090F1C3_MESPL|nr:conserved hypothetical protein [Mesorhizobium plurifarium]